MKLYKIPILLIIFNRADTALQVIDRLREIKPAQLFVAADAARKDIEGEIQKCELVRQKVLAAIDWECDVKTLFQEENLGCGMGPATAINWFFENVEQGIILEDDIIPLKSFFPFMEEMLVKYKDNEQIMQIGGNSMGIKREANEESYYFSAYNHWAWATWKTAWAKFNFSMQGLDEFLISGKLENYFTSPVQVEFWKYLLPQVKYMTSVWDYQWTYSIWNNKGLVVLPNVNLCKNIGFGEDSTHSSYESETITNANYEEMEFPLKQPAEIEQNKAKDKEMTTNIYQAPITKCPLSGNEITKSDRIKIKPLIEEYKEKLGLDANSYFENLEHLFLLESQKTAYRFFYPFKTVGNNNFLYKIDRKTNNSKLQNWLYSIAKENIKINNKNLEITYGQSKFQNKFLENSVNYENLDLSKNNIKEYAENYKQEYDVVCSFHKIQHIPEINFFIAQQLKMLKNGGRLIISVPNQKSYIQHYFNVLNMPPYTHSYWNIETFKSLEKIFNITIDKVEYNSVDELQKEDYLKAINKRSERLIAGRFSKTPNLIKPLLNKLLNYYFKLSMQRGDSMLVIFNKL